MYVHEMDNRADCLVRFQMKKKCQNATNVLLKMWKIAAHITSGKCYKWLIVCSLSSIWCQI